MEEKLVSPATSQAAPSMTSRTETKTCATCRQQFMTRIRTINGQDLCVPSECPDCNQKRRDEANKKAALIEFETLKTEQRKNWFSECAIPVLLRDKAFSNFEHALQPKAYDAVKAYDGKSSVILSGVMRRAKLTFALPS